MTNASRVALVTGASRGIGAAIARGLAERGVDVIGTSRSDAGRPAVEATGARWHPLDVGRRDSVGALCDDVEALDVLVNNAGIALDGFDADVVQRTLAVNFFGPMHVTDVLLSKLRPGARIVMVSSGVGELSGFPGSLRAKFEDPELDRDQLVTLVRSFEEAVKSGVHERHGWPSSAYKVSKAALNALTQVIARELEDDPRGICVNSVCPGWVATDMGGASAPRTPAEGAETPIWLALDAPADLNGKFLRDRAVIDY